MSDKYTIPLIAVTNELVPGQSGVAMVPMLGGAVGNAVTGRAGYLMVMPVAGGGGGDEPVALSLWTPATSEMAFTTRPLLTAPPANWAIQHQPAANTQATITRAAGGAGFQHVATSIAATLATVTADLSANVLVNLRDGASGAGTILWSARLVVDTNVATVAGQPIAGIALSGLNIPGSDDTAMTLEFSAGPGANIFETVALTGFTFQNT